ncbi:MAG TPA: glycogen/starch synthase [Candidatus Limnocylindrales bacterium]|nr:glycogen/starch synthase [Candidatus Limnocylindrales bacterium]
MSSRVAFIAAECEPWAKTGGLADVVDALARALGECGPGAIDGLADVYLPRYRGIDVPMDAAAHRLRVSDPTAPDGVTGLRIVDVVARGYRLRLVDHPAAFDRAGYYGEGADYPDNAWRFGLLCRAAIEAARSDPRPPDILHLHDWHAAPALLFRDGADRRDPVLARTATLLTIHNLAYHGWTPADRLAELGIAARSPLAGTNPDGLDLLGAAIDRADLVNTVSPGFAAEALAPEGGMDLDGRLRARGDRFFGILNGLDTDLWDPATDAALAAPYSRADPGGKAACRTALLGELGLDPGDPGPVLAMIGRLDPQKGFDLLAEAAPALLARGIRLAVLGTGHPELLATLARVAARRPGRIAIVERFDRDLARRMYAGADGFLMPSRFEPCGTGQMIALRYGTPPIVRSTGGLRDTVIDTTTKPRSGTGFRFEAAAPEALVEACERFLRLFEAGGQGWSALLDRGMAVDFDWRRSSAPAYVRAYERAIAIRRF